MIVVEMNLKRCENNTQGAKRRKEAIPKCIMFTNLMIVEICHMSPIQLKHSAGICHTSPYARNHFQKMKSPIGRRIETTARAISEGGGGSTAAVLVLWAKFHQVLAKDGQSEKNVIQNIQILIDHLLLIAHRFML